MNQTNKQDTKVALVTGAARRIGAAIAKELHHAGYHLIIHCHHSLKEAELLAEQLNQNRSHSVCVIQQDLTVTNAASDLINGAIACFGRLDVLVNNASVFTRTNLAVVDEQNWDLLFNTNVKAPFLLSVAARPYLELAQGVIINITDIHAEQALKEYSVYCQSKAAFVMQTKSLAREFAPQIRVNGVAPGAIAWPEDDNALSESLQQKIIASTPLKQHGKPQFIAQAALALIQNPFITGQIIKVDGGRSL